MAMTWPSVLTVRDRSAHLRNQSASGGRSSTGRDQRVFSDAGYWVIRMNEIIIKDRRTHDAYLAMVARLAQGEEIDVPVPTVYPPVNSLASTSDVIFAQAAALRATTVTLNSSGVSLEPGQLIEVGRRVHRITEITSTPAVIPYENQVANDSPWMDEQPWTDTVSQDADYTLKILPPLRGAVAVNTTVDLTNPTVRCILDDPNEGAVSIGASGIAFPSLTFRESI